MSDTAIFISLCVDELSSSGQLPGDLRSLRNLTNNDERVVHVEVICDAPLPEKTASLLHSAGALVTTLPGAADSSAALTGGLMARLHEFICAYAHVSQFILAGSDSDRLYSPAAFLQRAGYYVIVAGTDRGRLDGLRPVTDDLSLWSSRPAKREESSAPQLDPYEVLVDEVTRGREKGQRVLLTSLKQRMRRRMRRFDETRMKDQDGRPMRKFKDFIADAANRNLIQLIENGNRSHVLLPGEEIPENTEEDESPVEEQAPRKSRNQHRGREDDQDEESDDGDSDPLLDAIDMLDSGSPAVEPVTEQDLPRLSEEHLDVGSVNEDAPAPPKEFMEMLEKAVPETGWTLGEILKSLSDMKDKEVLKASNREIQTMLQNAFHNELLEPVNEDQPTRYLIVDDWRGIIDFL